MVIPQHVAIILDGNGRWAKSKGMPRNYGHVRGAKNLDDTCAREEWGWKPAYDLESMTVDMLEKLREKLK